jgi:uncharacterized membrane protein YtjA (UPF0391 family)
MLRWSIVFFVIGVIAAFFAYGDIQAQAALIAKSIFFVCVALFVITVFAMPLRRS